MAKSAERAAEQRARRRVQIVDAAKAVFAERGYHGCTINDIIQHAGIARGTFYLYFESKHAVFTSVLSEALVQLRQRIRRIDIGGDAQPPLVQLRGMLVSVFELVVGDPDLCRLLLTRTLGPDPEATAGMRAFYDEVQGLIISSLDAGIGLGLVRECDTSLVAAALVGTVHGLIEHALTEPSPDVGPIVDELITFVASGVLAGERWAT